MEPLRPGNTLTSPKARGYRLDTGRVESSTVARWIARARERLLTLTREELTARLGLTPDELDSLLRLVRSQLDVSLRLLLVE